METNERIGMHEKELQRWLEETRLAKMTDHDQQRSDKQGKLPSRMPWLVIAVAAVMTLSWIGFMLVVEGSGLVVKMPDGNEITYAGLSKGALVGPPTSKGPATFSHVLRPMRSPWTERYASIRRTLPIWLAKKLPPPGPLSSGSMTSGERDILIFRSSKPIKRDEWLLTWEDGTGWESPVVWVADGGFAGQIMGAGPHWFLLGGVVPRKGSQLKLNFRRAVDQQRGSKAVAALKFSNPLCSQSPSLTAQAVPLAKPWKNGTIQIKSVFVDAGQNKSLSGQPFQVELSYQVAGLARRAPGLALSYMEDGSGNLHPGSAQYSVVVGKYRLSQCLWPDDPVWRVRLVLKRDSLAEFDESELFRFEMLEIPPEGQRRELNMTIERMGRQITAIAIQRQRQDLLITFDTPAYWASLTDQTPPQILTLACNCLGPDSKEVFQLGYATDVNGSQGPSSDTRQVLSLKLDELPANATHVSMVFAVETPEPLEFTVKPEWRR